MTRKPQPKKPKTYPNDWNGAKRSRGRSQQPEKKRVVGDATRPKLLNGSTQSNLFSTDDENRDIFRSPTSKRNRFFPSLAPNQHFKAMGLLIRCGAETWLV